MFKNLSSFSKQRIQQGFLSWYNLNPTLYIFSSMPLKSGESGTILSKRSHFEGSRDQYSYGWSFVLATLGFLGSELSALLCLAAFLNRFDSEVIKFWLPLYIFKYTKRTFPNYVEYFVEFDCVHFGFSVSQQPST